MRKASESCKAANCIQSNKIESKSSVLAEVQLGLKMLLLDCILQFHPFCTSIPRSEQCIYLAKPSIFRVNDPFSLSLLWYCGGGAVEESLRDTKEKVVRASNEKRFLTFLLRRASQFAVCLSEFITPSFKRLIHCADKYHSSYWSSLCYNSSDEPSHFSIL